MSMAPPRVDDVVPKPLDKRIGGTRKSGVEGLRQSPEVVLDVRHIQVTMKSLIPDIPRCVPNDPQTHALERLHPPHIRVRQVAPSGTRIAEDRPEQLLVQRSSIMELVLASHTTHLASTASRAGQEKERQLDIVVIHIAMDGNIGDAGRKQFGGINTKQVEAFVEASTSSGEMCNKGPLDMFLFSTGVTSHLRQETNRPLQVLHKSNRMYMSKNLKEDLTEGDKLNAIKAYRQNNNLIMIKTNSLGVKDAP
uniref:Uncharacterized protein n=1 Tax=Timema cristinae TaxID=61476 RepID=A0A7R9D705_TIMCR|nr:unnamed protein product [Timema cristinae]